ncbi:MAG: response regulator [Bacteroidota bacterium]
MKKRIFIIDDDEDICGLMDYLLTREGFDVSSSGKLAGLTQKEAINLDLILMDNRLTDGYGTDFCKQIKENVHTTHIPVILISASDNLARLAQESNADGFLKKPFDIVSLVNIVHSFT